MILKRLSLSSTIREVWNDDKTICYGLVGTVGNLKKANMIENYNYPKDTWFFIPCMNVNLTGISYGLTRDIALKPLKEYIRTQK